jgi:hypothetical protein
VVQSAGHPTDAQHIHDRVLHLRTNTTNTHFVIVAIVVVLDDAHVAAVQFLEQVAVLVIREALDDASHRVLPLLEVLRAAHSPA